MLWNQSLIETTSAFNGQTEKSRAISAISTGDTVSSTKRESSQQVKFYLFLKI